jgi:hypothetical protein
MNTRRLSAAIAAASLALAAGCAGTPEVAPEDLAIRDYIEVGELSEVDSIRTDGRDRWTPLTEYFSSYEARDGWFLLEFNRRCWEMFDTNRITPDRRYDHNVMRRGADTLRGCRIAGMYPLTEAQAQELEALANPAGDGN